MRSEAARGGWHDAKGVDRGPADGAGGLHVGRAAVSRAESRRGDGWGDGYGCGDLRTGADELRDWLRQHLRRPRQLRRVRSSVRERDGVCGGRVRHGVRCRADELRGYVRLADGGPRQLRWMRACVRWRAKLCQQCVCLPRVGVVAVQRGHVHGWVS